MSKHTPGPWSANPYQAQYTCVTLAPDKQEERDALLAAHGKNKFNAISVGTQHGQVCIVPLDESNEANAALISAAPELLMMLKIHHKNCVDTHLEYREGGQDAVAYRATAAIIAKAEGNS